MGRKVVMMQKQIGNIILDYTYYKGQDLYSDGVIEDTLLDIVKTASKKIFYTLAANGRFCTICLI